MMSSPAYFTVGAIVSTLARTVSRDNDENRKWFWFKKARTKTNTQTHTQSVLNLQATNNSRNTVSTCSASHIAIFVLSLLENTIGASPASGAKFSLALTI